MSPPWRPVALLAAVLLALASTPLAHANEKTHKYEVGESIPLWTNKVGPYNNPQETFNYNMLFPRCVDHTQKLNRKFGSIGNVLLGNELIESKTHHFSFLQDVEKTSYCEMTDLPPAYLQMLYSAVAGNYWFEFYVDDLPIWGFVGKFVDDKAFLYTHQRFVVGHNDDRIVFVHLFTDEPMEITPTSVNVTLTYEVTFEESDKSFHRRHEQYLDFNFFQHKIHWFSIFNSFMMVIFLTGLVSMILVRTLRKDYARYAKEDDLESLERDMSEEYGWKLVHGDVFRTPAALAWLAALYGNGAQFIVQAMIVIFVAIAGALFMEPGAVLNTVIISGALTSFVGGYVSGSFYSQQEGKTWIKTMLLSTSFFPLTCGSIMATLNTVAWVHGSVVAIPFMYIAMLVAIFLFVTFPLSLAGTVVGRNWNGAPNVPCRTKRIPSPIPYRKWYLTPLAISAMGGLLPFGSIFIEMYFMFTSFWNYKVYYVYGFMLLVFGILMIVTACVSIVCTYFLLNAENYKWHWTAYLCSASTSTYVFLYAIHFYAFKTKMTGLYQAVFYFGYSSIFCLALGLMCGAMGFFSASMFVRVIYRNIKCD